MKRFPLRHALPCLVLAVLLLAAGPRLTAGEEGGGSPANDEATVPTITVSPDFPDDIPGGAPNAHLVDAAVFAWQELIAASWPAEAGKRDTPDTSKKLGEPGYDGPLVWETYRGKVETFPGESDVQPPGYVNDASKSYGYDTAPQDYVYGEGTLPPCSGDKSATTPWVNLDEVTQIGLNQMYAGAGPGLETAFPGPEILFLAKSNREHYVYSVQPRPAPKNPQMPYSGAKEQIDTSKYGLWNHNQVGPEPWETDNAAYNALVYNFAHNYQNGKAPASPHVDFPSGTIEAKAAWRKLTAAEKKSGRFHTQTVRYYTTPELYKKYVDPDAPELPGETRCYVDDELGLLALHLIHKTPSAPHFVFATFGQADNIQRYKGGPVENADGQIVSPPEQPPLCPGTCPSESPEFGIGTKGDPDHGIQVKLATGPEPKQIQQFVSKAYPENPAHPGGPYATCEPGKELYYQNTPAPLPQGTVCVTQRVHSIPPAIVKVNALAHSAIARYNREHGIETSPWEYYKLVNVQWKPVDKPAGQIYQGTEVPAATYYQANIVVETDYNLQVFSGQFQPAFPLSKAPDTTNLITDYWSLGTPMAGKPFHNVLYDGKRYNMGGCMGCHGNAAVNNGADFSFIMAGGRVTDAEAAGESAERTVPGTAKYYQLRGQTAPEMQRSGKPETEQETAKEDPGEQGSE